MLTYNGYFVCLLQVTTSVAAYLDVLLQVTTSVAAYLDVLLQVTTSVAAYLDVLHASIVGHLHVRGCMIQIHTALKGRNNIQITIMHSN